MKTSEFIRKIKRAGCILISHDKKHDRWYSPITGLTDEVPRHSSQEMKKSLVLKLSKSLLGK